MSARLGELCQHRQSKVKDQGDFIKPCHGETLREGEQQVDMKGGVRGGRYRAVEWRCRRPKRRGFSCWCASQGEEWPWSCWGKSTSFLEVIGVLLCFCVFVLGLGCKYLHITGLPAGCATSSCGDGLAKLGRLKQQSKMCSGGHGRLTSVDTTPPYTLRHTDTLT